VLALTRELAVVHARENIRVNALCPGPLRTELLMSFLDTEEKKQRRLVHVPMGRFGESTEIAQAALWLASDDSLYVTVESTEAWRKDWLADVVARDWLRGDDRNQSPAWCAGLPNVCSV